MYFFLLESNEINTYAVCLSVCTYCISRAQNASTILPRPSHDCAEHTGPGRGSGPLRRTPRNERWMAPPTDLRKTSMYLIYTRTLQLWTFQGWSSYHKLKPLLIHPSRPRQDTYSTKTGSWRPPKLSSESPFFRPIRWFNSTDYSHFDT